MGVMRLCPVRLGKRPLAVSRPLLLLLLCRSITDIYKQSFWAGRENEKKTNALGWFKSKNKIQQSTHYVLGRSTQSLAAFFFCPSMCDDHHPNLHVRLGGQKLTEIAGPP